VQVFEQEALKSKKEFLARSSRRPAPRTIRLHTRSQSGADASSWCCRDDNNAFCPRRSIAAREVKLLTEIVDLASIRAVGDAALGLIGSSRYSLPTTTR